MTGAGLGGLTPRQRQALDAYARRGSVKIAAHELGIAPRTVKWHLAEAKRRLFVDTIAQATLALARAAIASELATLRKAAPLDSVTPYGPSITLPAMITNGPDLRAARVRAGLTQDELARRLGLCRQRVSGAEGQTHLSPAFAIRCLAELEGRQ